jgi:hypothetical protein
MGLNTGYLMPDIMHAILLKIKKSNRAHQTKELLNTVKLLYNGHPWDLKKVAV